MVSIIIPAKNAELTISQTLESILSDDLVKEVIVVNDGSTDKTLSVLDNVNDQRMMVLEGQGQGVADAFNQGVAHAKYDLIARCDADDLYNVGRLGWQTEFLQSNTDYVAAIGGFTIIDTKGKETGFSANDKRPPGDATEIILQGTTLTTFCAWLFRKSAFEACGGIRPWFKSAEDIDIQFRLAMLGKIWFDPIPCYQYRISSSSITHTIPTAEREFYELWAKKFAAQRANGQPDDLERGHPPKLDNTDKSVHTADTHLATMLEGLAWKAYANEQPVLASKRMFAAIMAKPLSFGIWKSMTLLLVKSIFSR